MTGQLACLLFHWLCLLALSTCVFSGWIILMDRAWLRHRHSRAKPGTNCLPCEIFWDHKNVPFPCQYEIKTFQSISGGGGGSMSMVRAFSQDARDKRPRLCFLTLLLTRQVPTSTILEWVFPISPEIPSSASPSPLFIQSYIFLWCDWISGNLHIWTKSCFFDRSVLSDNQVSTLLSDVVMFTVGFIHWSRICANHRIRIVRGGLPLKRF